MPNVVLRIRSPARRGWPQRGGGRTAQQKGPGKSRTP